MSPSFAGDANSLESFWAQQVRTSLLDENHDIKPGEAFISSKEVAFLRQQKVLELMGLWSLFLYLLTNQWGGTAQTGEKQKIMGVLTKFIREWQTMFDRGVDVGYNLQWLFIQLSIMIACPLLWDSPITIACISLPSWSNWTPRKLPFWGDDGFYPERFSETTKTIPHNPKPRGSMYVYLPTFTIKINPR